LEIEGGLIAANERGVIVAEIAKTCQKRDMNIATRRIIFLGTNQYPNLNEQMLSKISTIAEDTSTGLKTYRGAIPFEALRLETEKYAIKSHRPRVFLFKIGNLNMRQARAGFITNFFGCAAYEIIDNQGFNTVEEGLEAANETQADLLVICSSDEEYATLGIDIAQKAKVSQPNRRVLIAGNPIDSIDALKIAGVDDFIHVKVNVLDTLKRYNQQLLK
jgi:methylmalonyl-CoA mutase